MLTRVSSDSSGAEERFVFVLELTGRPDAVGIDRAYDAILRYGSESGARVVVNVAGVRPFSDVRTMLGAAREALGTPVTVVGVE